MHPGYNPDGIFLRRASFSSALRRLGSVAIRSALVASTFLMDSIIFSGYGAYMFYALLLLDFSAVVKFLHLCDRLLMIFSIISSNLPSWISFHTFLQMLAFRCDIFTVRRLARGLPSMGNPCRTSYGTAAAAYTVKGFLCTFFKLALCAYAIYCMTFKSCVQAFVQALHPMQL